MRRLTLAEVLAGIAVVVIILGAVWAMQPSPSLSGPCSSMGQYRASCEANDAACEARAINDPANRTAAQVGYAIEVCHAAR